MARVNVDLSQIKAHILPEGIYDLRVDAFDGPKVDKNGKEFYAIKFSYIDPTDGEKYILTENYVDPSSMKFKRFVASTGYDPYGMVEDTDQFLGETARVEVDQEEYEGEKVNRIKRYVRK